MWGIIFGGITEALGAFLPRLLAALGFVAISEAVFRPYFVKLQEYVLRQFTAIPAEYQQLVVSTGVMDAVGIVFTAYFAAIGIKAAISAFSSKAGG